MQCTDVAEIIELDGISPLPEAARTHAAGCAACTSLIADLQSIVAVAATLPQEVEPPARVWVALRAQLEAEQIIREPQVALPIEASAPWWQGFGQLFRGRMLATTAIAILIAAAGYIQVSRNTSHPPAASAGTPANTASIVPETARVMAEPFADAGTSLDQEETAMGSLRTAQTASLSDNSAVDNSLRENLATLNTFIKECRKRLQENPHDQLARDYLSAAYQQKAEILAAMMERGRSVN
jgi:hypothetical protein